MSTPRHERQYGMSDQKKIYLKNIPGKFISNVPVISEKIFSPEFTI
jgi:hypothetical protein